MFQCYFHQFQIHLPLFLRWCSHQRIFPLLVIFLLRLEKFNLSSCIEAFLFVLFPNDVQPSHISTLDYPPCMNVQESVYILSVIICISNKHTCLSSVIQLGSHFLAFMYGNNCNFSKCSQTSCVFCFSPIEQCMRGLSSFWTYHYVVQFCCCGNDFTPELSFVY